MYIQVNIGRNIDNVPMGMVQWLEFQQKVIQALYDNTESIPYHLFKTSVEVHTGSGRSWDGEKYISEDSAKISLFLESGWNIGQLRIDLRELRSRFGQDSIALVIGSELI